MKYLNREMLHGNAETLVLALLAQKGCHGYRLRLELARQSRDYFQMGVADGSIPCSARWNAADW